MFCMSPLIAWHVRDRKTLQIIFTETVGEVSRLTLPLSFAARTHTQKNETHTQDTKTHLGEMSWSVDGCGRLSLTDVGLSLSPSVGSALPSATGR